MQICDVCFRHCNIEEGKIGFCGGRTCFDGSIIAANYGKITSVALDPIEKKPLKMFRHGKKSAFRWFIRLQLKMSVLSEQ